jgi:hypothetical protein
MCVLMYVYVRHIYKAHTYIYTKHIHTYIHAYTYAYMHKYIHTHPILFLQGVDTYLKMLLKNNLIRIKMLLKDNLMP